MQIVSGLVGSKQKRERRLTEGLAARVAFVALYAQNKCMKEVPNFLFFVNFRLYGKLRSSQAKCFSWRKGTFLNCRMFSLYYPLPINLNSGIQDAVQRWIIFGTASTFL